MFRSVLLSLSLSAGLLSFTTACRTETDADGDGSPVGVDCDDEDASISPLQVEVCDNVDQNCDGLVDNDATDALTFYPDLDGDGVGTASGAVRACVAPEGYVEVSGDCNDADDAYYPGAPEENCTDPNDYNCDGSVGFADADADGVPACEDCDDSKIGVHPGAQELCNAIDDDCDGDVDELGAVGGQRFYTDADADGYGDPAAVVEACAQPEGAVLDNTDCDDAAAAVNRGAAELCNEVDDNCDGRVDNEATDAPSWFRDVDGDGAAGASVSLAACAAPEGYFATATDCNDVNPAVHPGATESCNRIDDDCDGTVDESGATGEQTFYADADRDGYGDADVTASACEAPVGHVANDTDCDDALAAVNPGAVERCNGRDDDCAGGIDVGAIDAGTWYQDADNDRQGTDGASMRACARPDGYVAAAGDCDDEVPTTYTGAPELCNGVDDNCDTQVDAGAVDMRVWYRDADGDSRGTGTESRAACSMPVGFVLNADDCNDSVVTTYLNAAELCNGVDDDCNGVIDNGLALQSFYADADADGHGALSALLRACAAPVGYVSSSNDCDDNDPARSPSADEVCDDTVDNDCDTHADCLDNADCRDVEAICWECGDGYMSPDEECDDGDRDPGDGCNANCELEIDLGGVFHTYPSAGRTVHMWKSNPSVPVTTYNNFCQDRGLAWFTPKSQADAQALITNAYNLDAFHTWIITRNTTTNGTFGGYNVTVDSPGCVGYSNTGFSAIRKWGCSYCDPEVDGNGTTRCWDSNHTYDWLVCEG